MKSVLVRTPSWHTSSHVTSFPFAVNAPGLSRHNLSPAIGSLALRDTEIRGFLRETENTKMQEDAIIRPIQLGSHTVLLGGWNVGSLSHGLNFLSWFLCCLSCYCYFVTFVLRTDMLMYISLCVWKGKFIDFSPLDSILWFYFCQQTWKCITFIKRKIFICFSILPTLMVPLL